MDFSQEQITEILDRIEIRLGIMRKKKYDFYKESGVSSALYSNWKTGKAKPTAKTLSKIADYLGVSLEWLISGSGEERVNNLPQREQMRQEMRILFDAAEDAPTSAILEAAALLMRYKEQNK